MSGAENRLVHGTFEPLVGEVFRVRSPDGREADFELLDAANRADSMHLPEAFREPFSLLFDAPDDVDWAQGTFEFSHAAVGTHALFCTAVIHPTKPGRHAYEVVFA